MKKYFWTLSVMALFAVGFVASDEDESSSSSQTEQKAKHRAVGIYEATDKVGTTIRITVNEDKSATITGVRGENITYYCEWYDYGNTNRIATLNLSDVNKIPYLVFDGGTSANNVSLSLFLGEDGFLYYDVDPATRNPEWRIPYKKIE